MHLTKRSARLQARNQSKDEAEFERVFENGSRQVNLRDGMPNTPTGRASQKRKRPTSGNEPEVGRAAEANVDISPIPGACVTPKVLTQSRFQNEGEAADGVKLQGAVGGADIDDISFGNDSFMIDVVKHLEDSEKMEVDGVADTKEQKDVEFQNEEVNTESCSQDDVFGDDADFMEAFPETPELKVEAVPTPKRSRRRSIITARPSGSTSGENGVDAVPGLSTVKDVFAQPENTKEAVPNRSRNPRKKAAAKGGPIKKKKGKRKFKLAFTERKATKVLANSASNELSKDDLSCLSAAEKLQLSAWGLPAAVLNNYRSKGITSLFQWQLDCLANEKVLEGRNLLYSAPTSAGKTLVSEILMIKRVLELGRKAIMILPFVSVAREKVHSLQSIFGDAGIRVEGFMGSVNPAGGFRAVDIAICTIEKANSLINKLLEEDGLADLGTLVVDELHLIGDPHRGYLLELLLTKILYMTSLKNGIGRNNSCSMSMNSTSDVLNRRYHIQVIGMSATLPNLDTLAGWLNAELYVTDFRPVPLKQNLKLVDKLLDENLEPIREVVTEEVPIKIPEQDDPENIIYLTLETVLSGFSVLIFCPSKSLVESTADKIRTLFLKIGHPASKTFPAEIGERLRAQLNAVRINSVIEQLDRCPGGVDEVLKKAVMVGIGYHHAGLTYENRDIVESAFKRGILKVIVATSTLSAGVNLPARRVMIVSPLFNGSPLNTLVYQQMCGRAGRNGIDTEGESILICPSGLKDKGVTLFKGEMPPVRSALLGDGSLTSSMKRALLEAIASRIATPTTDVRAYAKCTFLFHSLDSGLYASDELSSSQLHKESTIDECVQYLEANRFIRVQHFEDEGRPDEYMPTRLGSACLASSLSPDDGLIVYQELYKASKSFVLRSELHIIYQVTPIYVSSELRYISWADYHDIFDNLDDCEKGVAELVGVKASFLINARMTGVCLKNATQKYLTNVAIHQRFFAAMALSDLVNEMTLEDVSHKYKLPKGTLQNLQQAASTFAGMITAFCSRLGWDNLELLLGQFQERLEFGVQRALCDLVRLDCLNGQRARILYDKDIKTIMELAATDPARVENILHNASPFKSDVHGGRESSIWMIGKESLTESEAAQKIVAEARSFIQTSLGQKVWLNYSRIAIYGDGGVKNIELGQQGNIQFAFGQNDAPILPPTRLSDSTSVARKSVSFQVNSELDEQPDNLRQNPVIHASLNDQQEIVLLGVGDQANLVEIDSPKDSKADKNDNDNSTDDADMEDVFTQQFMQLESSKMSCSSGNEIVQDIEEEDMFEESFPEIVPVNISELYPEQLDQSNEPGPDHSQKFSIADHVEQILSGKSKIAEALNQQHTSTPLAVNKQSRFTIKNESPVPNVSSPVSSKGSKGSKEMHREGISFEQEQLSVGCLAEFDKGFDSSTSMAEVFESSLKIVTPSGKDTKINAKLSESDAAAALAMADDDSKFESEELFPIPVVGEQKCIPYLHDPNKPPSAPIKIEANHYFGASILDGLDEEDFIATQGPSYASEDGQEMFEESDREQEEKSTPPPLPSGAVKTSPASPVKPSTPVILRKSIGKKTLTVKIIQTVDLIPEEFFMNSTLLGVGLKLASSKGNSTTSIARQGIGARVLGKKASNTSLNGNDQNQKQHSIGLYDGQDTIWVFRWNKDSLCVGNGETSGRKGLEALLFRIEAYQCYMSMFDSKDKLRNLLKTCGAHLLNNLPKGNRIMDPKIARWVWDFDEDEGWKSISKKTLIDEYVKDDAGKKVATFNWDKEVEEAFYCWRVMTELKKQLEKNGLWTHFIETEMPSTIPLMIMEMNGFGLDSSELSKLKRVLQYKRSLLELKSFQLAGRQFNLNSTKELQKVLFKDLGLKQPREKGTAKAVLQKIDHELPKLIIEYRKVTSALQKFVIQFQQEKSLETGRVHGYYHLTVTGRSAMSDPSLQCIPRDFDIEIRYDEEEVCEVKNSCKIKFGSKLNAIFQQLDTELLDKSLLEKSSVISMRNVFVPCSQDFVILTADYSQLELRIMAHLSGDAKLLEALNKNTDVLVEIAAQWKNLPAEQITYSMRQQAKEIAYGVMYGMGPRALSEKMEISERDADVFIRNFMKTYLGVSKFMDDAVKMCRRKGFVETMLGRRRYLPKINSLNHHEKAKASRQAINSQIQGSAADLVKCAMTKIHATLASRYPNSSLPIEWTKVAKARRSTLTTQPCTSNSLTSQLDDLVFFPILNLHDELIFEVRRTHLDEVARLIKFDMESCLKLRAQLPVVVKTGETWGTLEPYQF